MNYNALWTPPAETRLLALLLRANDKPGLFGVVQRIDATLSADPHSPGESRNPGERVWFPRPLCVYYRVDDMDHIVYIMDVRFVGD